MAEFGQTTHDRPDRVDQLLGSSLMSHLDRLDVVARKIFAGKIQGERRSRRRGVSVEFADYRHYTPGDDLRFVDWNVYARLDRLFLKVFLEEEELTLGIAVDASASMEFGNPNKFDFARRLAMSLGYIGLSSHNRVGLYSFNGGGVERLPTLRGRRRTREMGQWLLGRRPGGETAFDDAMRTIATTRQGRGVMIVISDFLFEEGMREGLRFLVGGGWDVFAMQTLSPEEIDPSEMGMEGDLRLEDAETGLEREVTVTAPLIRRYRSRLDAWCEDLRATCARLGVGSARVSTDVDMEQLLIRYLRGRGLLR